MCMPMRSSDASALLAASVAPVDASDETAVVEAADGTTNGADGADAAGAADAVLSAQLPFYFYVAGLAPTLDPAPPIGLDISAYLARRVGAAGDGGSAGALARNLTLRGQHLLPFPGAMAIAFGDVGVVGARFVDTGLLEVTPPGTEVSRTVPLRFASMVTGGLDTSNPYPNPTPKP